MCIRDSDSPGRDSEAQARVAPALGAGGIERFEATQASAGAVSYTHLRANETVLDLGCRLLLEQQKT